MNFDLIDNFLRMANVTFCLALMVMVLIQHFQKKTISTSILLLVLILFVLLNISLFIDSDIDGFIILMNILISICLVQIIHKNKSTNLSNSNYKQLQESANLLLQAKEQERSRIYANLHDDVGAKLLELIYKAKDDESKSLAKQVLSKIRHAVASTENIQSTVEQLVESLLHEAQLRLETSDIHLIESIKIQNPQQRLKSTMPMTLIRIVREVLSNCIKHAKANKVECVICSDEHQLLIKIIDNGKGFEKNQVQGKETSKGFKTISKRAESISATTSIQSILGTGTTFELTYNYANK